MPSRESPVIAALIRGFGMVTSCVESQVLAGISAADASKRLFDSYSQRIESLPRLKADDEIQIIRAISTSGFDATQKETLLTLVHNKSCARSTVVSSRSKNQSCELYENFIPDTLWERLKTLDRTDEACATIIAQHASSIGLVNASEKTLRRMVAVLGWVQNYQRVDQDTLVRLKTSIQEQLHGLSKTLPQDFPYLLTYRCVHIIRRCEIIISFVFTICFV